ncbi:hypothetical protein [Cohnella lupini]|uniref:Uncharacterized protein n=1 Tax=Cohnella lupini TaxID=1294267 RepID=A0A3D9I280_9BACL|nr:hypothetical protein [Cohnella lupini]RED55266.1 hypothetical protein DFP95_1181 [Cohnella lupini]
MKWNKELNLDDIIDINLSYCMESDQDCIGITVSKDDYETRDINGNKVAGEAFSIDDKEYKVFEIDGENKMVNVLFINNGVTYYARLVKGVFDGTGIGLVWKEESNKQYADFAASLPWDSLFNGK